MTPLQAAIERHGGLMAAYEIRAMGLSAGAISVAVADDEIARIRQGWYANPWLPIPQQHAARVGGQLACSAAASALGMWEPKLTKTHVCVPVNAARLRSPTAYRTRLGGHPVEVHWTGLDPRGTRTIVSPLHCIRQIAECEAPEIALAVAESGLHRRVIHPDDWTAALALLPRRVRRFLDAADARSETGSESVFLYRIGRAGVSVRQQVQIGAYRVDFLIGDRLIVEVDSRRYHPDAAVDRERDARLSMLGYRVLRFLYQQVMDEWPMVEGAVLAAIARGDHLPPERMKEPA